MYLQPRVTPTPAVELWQHHELRHARAGGQERIRSDQTRVRVAGRAVPRAGRVALRAQQHSCCGTGGRCWCCPKGPAASLLWHNDNRRMSVFTWLSTTGGGRCLLGYRVHTRQPGNMSRSGWQAWTVERQHALLVTLNSGFVEATCGLSGTNSGYVEATCGLSGITVASLKPHTDGMVGRWQGRPQGYDLFKNMYGTYYRYQTHAQGRRSRLLTSPLHSPLHNPRRQRE